MRQVKNKLINVSYKGILRISPNDDDADWGVQEYRDAGQDIVVSDSDGTNLPLSFTGDGVRVDGTFGATGDATFSNVVTFNGDVNAVGELRTQTLNVENNFVVDGLSTLKGNVTLEKNLTVKGETGLNVLRIEDKNLYIKHGTQQYNLNFETDPEESTYVLEFGTNDIQTYPLRKKLKEYGYNTGTGGGSSTGSSGSSVGDIKWSFMGYLGNESDCSLVGWLPLTGTICDKNYFWRLFDHLQKAYGKDEFTISDKYFQLPDVRGMFPRFANTSENGYDAGRKMGTVQNSASPNIRGSFEGNVDDGSQWKTGAFYYTGTGAVGANGQGYTGGVIGFDATRSSLVYRTYDVDKYPLTEEDKQAMSNLDEAGRLDYVQKKIDALSEEERNYYTLKETRPVNYPFNAYIFGGRNDEDFKNKFFDLEQKIKEVTVTGGDPAECKEIGKVARATKKEKYRFADCSNLTELQEAGFVKNSYTNFDYNLMSLDNQKGAFEVSTNLVSFSSDLPCLTDGKNMFLNNSNMTSFTGTFPKLYNGDDMFYGCSLNKSSLAHIANVMPVTNGDGYFNATTGSSTFDPDEIALHNKVIEKGWKGFLHYSEARLSKTIDSGNSLQNVTSAYKMFSGNVLTLTMQGNLDSLVYGKDMFSYCRSMNSFSSQLPMLENGCRMFCACAALSQFKIHTPKLKYGNDMFYGCISLQTLDLDLSSLETADDMFFGCVLNGGCVNEVAIKIKDWSGDEGTHNIGLGVMYRNEYEFNCVIGGYNKIKEKNWNVLLHNKYVSSYDSKFNSFVFPENTCRWFYQNTNIDNFSPKDECVANIKNGNYMFSGCMFLNDLKIKEFKNLVNGQGMFRATQMGSVTKKDIVLSCEFPKLVIGYEMFQSCHTFYDNTYIGLREVRSEGVSFEKLLDGRYMFSYCQNLINFQPYLRSLVAGDYMFLGCKLDLNSLKRIASGIKDVTQLNVGDTVSSEGYEVVVTKNITLGINRTPTEEDEEQISKMTDKGWCVTVTTNQPINFETYKTIVYTPQN